jgi:hypothetical protein
MEKKLYSRKAATLMPSVEWAKSSFPVPKFRTVKDTGTSKNAPKFFQYWAKLPADKQDLVVVKVYRLWPVCDLKAINPTATIEWDTMTGKIPFPAEEYETAFMHKYGSGEWKVLLTESGVSGIVAQCLFSAIDLNNHAPRLDYRTLVQGNFKNQDYIKWLERQPNLKLPWTSTQSEAEEQEHEEEMNVATQLTEGILSQNQHLIEKLDEAHEELRESKHAPQGPTLEDKAAAKVLDVYADSAKAAVGMVVEQAKTLATAAAPSFDPVALFKVGMEARGSDNGMAMVQLILASQAQTMEQVQKMHHETIEFLSKRDEEEPQPIERGVVATAEPENRRSFLSEIKEMTEFAEMMGFKRGAAAENTATGPTWMDKIGSAIAGNPGLAVAGLTLIANIFYNMRSQNPISPQDALKVANSNGSLPGATPSPAAATPGQPQTPTPAQQQAEFEKFMEFLTPHFLNHYNPDNPETNGYTFAEDLQTLTVTPSGMMQVVTGGSMTPAGRNEYEKMRNAGLAGLDKVFRAWPGIWSVISNSPHSPTNPTHYTKFIQEFLAYDQWSQQASAASKVSTIRPS